MVVIQGSDNTNGTKADLKRGQGGVPGALTLTPPSRGAQSGELFSWLRLPFFFRSLRQKATEIAEYARKTAPHCLDSVCP